LAIGARGDRDAAPLEIRQETSDEAQQGPARQRAHAGARVLGRGGGKRVSQPPARPWDIP